MPDNGDMVEKFDRLYMYVNPDPSLGPGTWNLVVPAEIGSGGGGGGANIAFEGELPIEVTASTDPGTTVTTVKTNMDIFNLPPRIETRRKG